MADGAGQAVVGPPLYVRPIDGDWHCGCGARAVAIAAATRHARRGVRLCADHLDEVLTRARANGRRIVDERALAGEPRT